MNSAKPVLAAGESYESWAPVLRLAAQEVFDLMLGCHLEVPHEPPADTVLEITSMVGLAGVLCGIMTVRCSSKSAAQMASKMLGIDIDKAGPEMWDAAGEICNMVAGNFKNKISGLGDGCMLSVPTVITGADYSLHPMPDNDSVQTTLLFEGAPVVLSLEVHT
jgi:chemotaxis protein CheX